MKQRKKIIYPEAKILDLIFFMLFLVVIISSVFDLSVTYVNYEEDEDRFLLREGNYLLVWGLEQNIPFFASPAILLNFMVIALGGDTFLKYRKKRTRGWAILLMFTMFAYLAMSIGHFVGGFSWI